MEPTTISALLAHRAVTHPDKTGYTFLDNGERESHSFTYRELDRSVRGLAARLRDSCAPGDRALVLATDNSSFIRAFLACQYVGVIAVPVFPFGTSRSAHRIDTLVAIARDCDAVVVISATADRIRATAADLAPELACLDWVDTDEDGIGFEPAASEPEDIAFLQYTSGSTSTPKGVLVTHRSLLTNERMFAHCFGLTEDEVIVSWLPPFHDMGLIGMVLQSLYLGAHAVLMPSLAFVQRPARWLRAIHRYHGTMSGAPNFAYELCLRRVSRAEQSGLDLSTWRVAFSGAEPIRAATMAAFADRYAPNGFDRTASFGGYGLAEMTLVATTSAIGSYPTTVRVSADALRQGLIEPGEDHTLVGVGHLRLDREVVIADPETETTMPDGRVGEVWLAGGDVAAGYWRRSAETARTFGARLRDTDAGPYLRTGDLGVLLDGELFITGRIKDLLIVGGLNHYPQDIEATVEGVDPWIRPGCVAVFAREPAGAGQDEAIVVAELARPSGVWNDPPNPAALVRAVRAAVSDGHGITVGEIAFVRPGSVPKTSSGKLRRAACRIRYLAGELAPAMPVTGEAR
jgi:acyl-CoA synthetase (AMP-forming)/AMP-acid ligase II